MQRRAWPQVITILRFCLRLTPVSALLSGLLIQTSCCGGADCLILLAFENLAVLMTCVLLQANVTRVHGAYRPGYYVEVKLIRMCHLQPLRRPLRCL